VPYTIRRFHVKQCARRRWGMHSFCVFGLLVCSATRVGRWVAVAAVAPTVILCED
jgi:hypothetical protein